MANPTANTQSLTMMWHLASLNQDVGLRLSICEPSVTVFGTELLSFFSQIWHGDIKLIVSSKGQKQSERPFFQLLNQIFYEVG